MEAAWLQTSHCLEVFQDKLRFWAHTLTIKSPRCFLLDFIHCSKQHPYSTVIVTTLCISKNRLNTLRRPLRFLCCSAELNEIFVDIFHMLTIAYSRTSLLLPPVRARQRI